MSTAQLDPIPPDRPPSLHSDNPSASRGPRHRNRNRDRGRHAPTAVNDGTRDVATRSAGGEPPSSSNLDASRAPFVPRHIRRGGVGGDGSGRTVKDQPTAVSADDPHPRRGHANRGGRRGGARRDGGRGGRHGGALGSNTASDVDTPPSVSMNGQSRRRRQFGSQLTADDSAGQPTVSSKPASTSRSAISSIVQDHTTLLEHADLRTRLTAELASGAYDCLICFGTIEHKDKTWHCADSCWTVLHLKCVEKWAEKSVKMVEEANSRQEDEALKRRKGNWRCPGCQLSRQSIPRAYRCFCARFSDPRPYKLSNATPHSCGKPCSRKRPLGCPHGCSEMCHPGPCPPCPVVVEKTCWCGGEKQMVRCSQLTDAASTSQPGSSEDDAPLSSKEQGVSCGKPCGRLLNCGMHVCHRNCHPGPCHPCSELRTSRCYCSREQKEMVCGSGDSKESEKDGQKWKGWFDCGSVCQRPFDCGVHSCLKSCHPQTPSAAVCPTSPSKVTTCPCGKTPISRLADRTSCSDPIPTCGATCNAKLPGCDHRCTLPCHTGSCPPCAEPVSTPCRCGNTKVTATCAERQREEEEGRQEVLCTSVCKALRSCGRHQCATQCCPLAFQAAKKSRRRIGLDEADEDDPAGWHACKLVCNKLLSCALHVCPLPCHRGACPPCLQATFEEISCHCQRTVLEPPVPCGTKVQCNFPCDRDPPPCGHPRQPHTCHQEGPCPPCVFLTEKPCACGKNVVKNVRCSQTKVSCGTPCGRLLNCGYHRCTAPCHPEGQCGPCDQICGKAKRICQHPCDRRCHAPTACPETQPCSAIITLTCSCGKLNQSARCSACVSSPSAAKRENRQLKCNDACLVAQRNARLADALGISNPEERAREREKVEYEPELRSFYAANKTFADGVEKALNEFMASSRQGHYFPSASATHRKFTHDLAEKYRLNSESVDQEPRRSVIVRKQIDSRVPSPLISEAWKASVQRPPRARQTALEQMKRPQHTANRISFNAILLEGVFGHDATSLRSLISPCLRGVSDFHLKWVGDEDVVLTPVFATSVEAAMRLQPIRTDLRSLAARDGFATAVVLVGVDPDGHVQKREDQPAPPSGGAGSASSASAAAAPPKTGWSAVVAGGVGGVPRADASASNAWASGPRRAPFGPKVNASVLTPGSVAMSPAGSSTQTSVIAPAVRSGLASPAVGPPRSEQREEDIPDDWESSL